MRKSLLLFFSIILIMAGCDTKQNTNDKVMEIINRKVYTVASIDSISSLIKSSDDLTKEQVNSLRMEVGDFIREYAEHLCDSLNDRLNDPALTPQETRELLTAINNMSEPSDETGVGVFKVEGYVTYDISPIFIADIFRDYLNEAEYEFAQIEQQEMESPSNIDAEVTISYQEVADRLWRCERLMTSDSINEDLKISLKPYINTYMIIMIYGADNTPAFDWDTHMMSQDVKDAILNYISEHPESECTAVLKEYVTILEKSRYYESHATRAFYFNYLRNN
ncbi:MAG: hypothetical protein KBT41_07145 [bacterium]|nr:hypothetical protein [Candidatus Colousia faecequi]